MISDFFYISEKLPLEKAIKLSYEELKNNLVKNILDGLSLEQIPFYFIYDFLEFGTNSLFKIREIIPEDYLKRSNFQNEPWNENCYNLYHSCKSNHSYIDIIVKSNQLKKYIKTRKNEYKHILKQLDNDGDKTDIEIISHDEN